MAKKSDKKRLKEMIKKTLDDIEELDLVCSHPDLSFHLGEALDDMKLALDVADSLNPDEYVADWDNNK